MDASDPGIWIGYAVNSFSIAAVTSIMNGEADEWLEELTAYLHKNLEETLEFIHKYKLPLVPYVPEGKLSAVAGLQTSRNWDRAFRPVFMEKTHIHLDDGKENFGNEGAGFIRINFAVTNEVLKEALERIRVALKENK